jgi:hypothetical protein
MAGLFVARSIGNIFSKGQSDYYFKHASLDPFSSQGHADPQEKELIHAFSDNRELKYKRGILEKKGARVFYVAKPIVVRKGCLRCHGSTKYAPKAVVEKYPGPNGYGWSVDQIIATFIVYVPIQKALAAVKTTAIKIALIGVLSICMLVIAIWFFMNTVVTKPVIELTELTDEMARGE